MKRVYVNRQDWSDTMITIRTDKGIEYARAAAAKRGCPHISVILFVPGEPAQRDYVFKSAVRP